MGVESGEDCVEQHLGRDCTHYPWALGDACPYLPIMRNISKDGGEDTGPRQVVQPRPAGLVAKACVGLCVCVQARACASVHTDVCRAGGSSGCEGM